jgi:hypothetical protein
MTPKRITVTFKDIGYLSYNLSHQLATPNLVSRVTFAAAMCYALARLRLTLFTIILWYASKGGTSSPATFAACTPRIKPTRVPNRRSESQAPSHPHAWPAEEVRAKPPARVASRTSESQANQA